MEFASQEMAANGKAALALMTVLLKRLFPETLSGGQLAVILSEAEAMIGPGPGRIDVEARRIVHNVATELGNPK